MKKMKSNFIQYAIAAMVILLPGLAMAQVLGDADTKLKELLQEAVGYMYIFAGASFLGLIGFGLAGRWNGKWAVSLIIAMLLLVGVGGFMQFMFGVNPFA